ncbi:tetraspanin-33 isoform X1 [Acipenser ruthenus]|uniref:tetraspanin-33 isoform X1 n=1 Tax=Acipenser ruthenus TaxID=7906 RepID=UPI00145ACD2B|nr:tetraspanin-33 isoform X1 [Acipenser ruthenus]
MKTCGGIKYTLFACCYIFWVSSAVLISVGIYAKIAKEGGAVDSLTADPALLLIVVGSFMFIITFFGCFGALRDALNLLNIFAGILVAIIVLQIAAAALGFVFSDLVLIRTEAVMRRGITTYRDDLDLQNLIDFVQKKFQCCGVSQYTDWSHNVYFNCVDSNPSLERCGVPYSCCIKNNESILNTMCGYGMQSFKAWSIEDKIHLNGCLKKIGTWGRQNLLIIGGITTGLCLLEIFMITLAAVQTYQIKKIREKRRKSTVRKSNPSYKTTVMC